MIVANILRKSFFFFFLVLWGNIYNFGCNGFRRFTYDHLAQLKFILPEVIEIKRVLLLDERTSCMKPNLHVTINVDALENAGKLKSEAGNTNLRKVFRSRLVDFSKSHPEV